MKYRERKSSDLLTDKTRDFYTINLRLSGKARADYEAAIRLISERMTVTPSNPQALAILVQEYLKNHG